MNIMEMLQKKLDQTTNDFYALYQENKQLKSKIEQLQEKMICSHVRAKI